MVALGGIGEIGRNMTVYEYDGRLLVVDCGVLFPEDGQPGVDLILPDLRLVEDRVEDIDAVVITHGHEDHIGALPVAAAAAAGPAGPGGPVLPRADRQPSAASTGSPRICRWSPRVTGARSGRSTCGSTRSTTPFRTRSR